jgi:hypothetical protein
MVLKRGLTAAEEALGLGAGVGCWVGEGEGEEG